jgi:DNA-binding beta-propeller fold protein YncE
MESKYSIATVISYSSLVMKALMMGSLYPYGVAYDHNNNRIIVADTLIIEYKYSIATVISYSSLVIMALMMDSLISPFGVAYDPNNNRIIVADTFNHRIQVFDSNGNFLFKFGNLWTVYHPFGVAYDHNNNRIIVADTV